MSDDYRCPHCGRKLLAESPWKTTTPTGKIGYCPVEKKWVICDETDTSLIPDLNALEQKDRQAKAKKEEEKIKKQKKSAVMKVTAVLFVIAAIAAAVYFVKIRPDQQYKSASLLFEQGDYESAKTVYTALKGYRDSEDRILICSAFLELQQNDIPAAIVSIEEIQEKSKDGLPQSLKALITDTVSHWDKRNLSPDGLLTLLQYSDLYDTDQTLDKEALFAQAHAALLPEEPVLWYTSDENGDDQPDLVSLQEDITAHVYEMKPESNQEIKLTDTEQSGILLTFADKLAKADNPDSILCYQKSYDLSPSDQAGEKISAVCMDNALEAEKQGDNEPALQEAKKACEVFSTKETFRFLYDMEYRMAQKEVGNPGALTQWQTFLKDYENRIEKNGLTEDSIEGSGKLYLAQAQQLAARKDPAAAEYLQKAKDCGADISADALKAAEQFEKGAARIKMIRMALDAAEGEDAAAYTAAYEEELKEALNGWKENNITPEDTIDLLSLAGKDQVEIPDAERIYEEAALSFAETQNDVSGYAFGYLEGDGSKDFAAVTKDGMLLVYSMKDKLEQICEAETGLKDASVELQDAYMLLQNGEKNAFSIMKLNEEKEAVNILARDQIDSFSHDGTIVAYRVPLAGSIDRGEVYQYSLETPGEDPALQGIEWHESDYPWPETPQDLLQRYFEARSYKIADETALLTGGNAQDQGAENPLFTMEPAASLPEPDAPAEISTAVYDVEGDQTYAEISYLSNGEKVHRYVLVSGQDQPFIAGFGEKFIENEESFVLDESIPLVPLNSRYTGHTDGKDDKDIYRILLPRQARLQLIWQAYQEGKQNSDQDTYQVVLYDGLDTTPLEIRSYSLKLSEEDQPNAPVQLPGGVYYMQVIPLRKVEGDYSLTLNAQADEYLETENNNTPETANEIKVNQSYTASLENKADTDYFVFTLEQASKVNISLQAEKYESRTPRHTADLFRKEDGKPVGNLEQGNKQLQSATGDIYLNAGTYLLKVYNGADLKSDVYCLTVKSEEAGNCELEYNDSSSEAAPIQPDVVYNASVALNGDIDYYSLTLDKDMALRQVLSFTPFESTSKPYSLRLFGPNQEANAYVELMKTDFGSKESNKEINQMVVKAGTYLFRLEDNLSGDSFVKSEYQFEVMGSEVECAEAEPNDTSSQAVELPLGQEITGVLHKKDDIDYYRIDIPEDMPACLEFYVQQTGDPENSFTLRLEYNGKEKWKADSAKSGDDGNIVLDINTISAGEFYLSVKASDASKWNGSLYTLKFSKKAG